MKRIIYLAGAALGFVVVIATIWAGGYTLRNAMPSDWFYMPTMWTSFLMILVGVASIVICLQLFLEEGIK